MSASALAPRMLVAGAMGCGFAFYLLLQEVLMSFGSPVFMESFESRMLLSAGSASAPVDDPAVIEAKAEVMAAREKMAEDRSACRSAMEGARAELLEVKEAFKEELSAIQAQFAADREAAKAALSGHAAAIREVKESYMPIIEADREAMKAAREAGDHEAFEEARAKLASDLKALRAELAPLVEAMKTDREAWRAKLSEGREALKEAQAAFRAALAAELEELKVEKDACVETITADREALAAALEKLQEALRGAGQGE